MMNQKWSILAARACIISTEEGLMQYDEPEMVVF